eukprot:SAG22_NODE_1211_length_5159_cov_105.112253_5_plen_121_part_00
MEPAAAAGSQGPGGKGQGGGPKPGAGAGMAEPAADEPAPEHGPADTAPGPVHSPGGAAKVADFAPDRIAGERQKRAEAQAQDKAFAGDGGEFSFRLARQWPGNVADLVRLLSLFRVCVFV